MTIKSIKLLSSLSVCAIAASITIASCDKSAEPTGPSKSNGKPPQVLSGCPTAIGSSLCPIGNATATYDEDGVLQVRVTGGDLSSGIEQRFDASANSWNGYLQAGNWGTDGALALSARDASGETLASLTLRRQGTSLSVLPYFSSAPGGDVCNYDVIAYRGSQQVAIQTAVPMTRATLVQNGGGTVPGGYGWTVKQGISQCQYNILLNGGTVTLPNGTSLTGVTKVAFIENSPNGVYIYVATSSLTINSNYSYALPATNIAAGSAQ